MAPLEEIDITEWSGSVAPETQRRAADALESGIVLFLPRLGFAMDDAERKFLSADLSKGDRKNITLDPRTGTCQGTDVEGPDKPRLEGLLNRFAQQAETLMQHLIPPYAGRLERARTTLRPIEIAGRSYSPKKDDRLLHVDAFPSRPTHGRRIMRLFTNVNPEGKSRQWRVGEKFEDFAKSFMPRLRKPNAAEAWLLSTLGITKGKRSPYDQLMLQLHDRGKLDAAYQQGAPHYDIAFPPQSTWICFTDQVLHAALAGQFALEQTFHLDVADMVDANRSPIRILERMTGTALS
jgi:hypothetical protein